MRITSLLRRSTAVLAASAMLSAGGTGLLAGTAHAGPLAPVITSISPSGSANVFKVTMTLTGENFIPQRDTVQLVPHLFTGTEVDNITGSVSPTQLGGTKLQVTFDLPAVPAAPGSYEVVLKQTDPANPTVPEEAYYCCFGVTSLYPPNATSTVFGPDTAIPNSTSKTDRSAFCSVAPPGPYQSCGPVDINGSNFARGARVELLIPASATPDPYATFTVGNGTARTQTAYPSSTLIRGNFATTTGFTPGKHLVKVIGTDRKTGSTAELWLPTFSTVTPAVLGAGSRNQTVTLTGAGIRAGSSISITNLDDDLIDSSCTDITVGAATVSADGTSISAPVTLEDDCGNPVGTGGRAVTIVGPDGGRFTKADAFRATAQPSLDYPGSGLKVGRGGTINDVTLTGDGLQDGASITFGDPKVTAFVQAIASDGKSIRINITAAAGTSPATLGEHNITVTNPDGGSGTVTADDSPRAPADPAPLTVNPAPVVASVSPASTTPANPTVTVSITGSDFESPKTGAGLQVTFSRPGLTASNLSVTQGANGAADSATFTLNVDPATVPGLSHIILTNTGDKGTSTCVDCFGIDSLIVSPAQESNSPAQDPNSVGTQLTFTPADSNGTGLTATSDPYLSLVGGNPDQPDIHAMTGTITVSGKSVTAKFDLTRAAPGRYNAIASGTPQLSCSACFTVTGTPATLTGIRRDYDPATVKSTKAGQGAVNVRVALDGTNFQRGHLVVLQTTDTLGEVTQSTATVHDVRFVDSTHLTALVDVPADAPTGAQDVVLTNADGQSPSKLAGAFTITAGPVPTAVSPASAGQGATGLKVTITGTDFDPSPQVDFGQGITVTGKTVTQGQSSPTNSNPDDTLEATITIDEAADLGPRTITVTNPDSGKGSLAGKFSVTAGPKVQSISPSVLKPGGEADGTIVGSGFKDGASVSILNVTVTVSSVAADGTSMAVHLKAQSPCTASADPPCALGARSVMVANSDGGRGTKADAFIIGSVPTAPRSVVATFNSAGTAATVTWAAPASDGGSPVASYVVSNNIVAYTVPATSPRSYTFTGLTTGRSYAFNVRANNGVGTGPSALAARIALVLTSTANPSVGLAGSTSYYSGRLTRAVGGSVLSGKLITVTLTPYVGSARTFNVRTGANGTWSLANVPSFNTTVKASFAGSVEALPASKTYAQYVRTRLTRTSPSSGATSSHTTVLTVAGYTTPNKAGRTVYLRRGTSNIASAVVASNGTFALRSTLPIGNYTLTIYIGATTGNVASTSTAFVIHRT